MSAEMIKINESILVTIESSLNSEHFIHILRNLHDFFN